MQARVTIHADDQVPIHRVIQKGDRLVLGRGSDASLRLDDKVVSRKHAEVELREDGIYVRDLGSRNGTFIGSDRLSEELERLPTGKVVRLGEHTVSVKLIDVPEGVVFKERHLLMDAPPLPKAEFEILGEIGLGAVGRVWAARQKLLKRMVAVKELRKELDLDDEEQQRFLREARVCCQIRSAHVVELYDMRVVDGKPYLIMELVGGPTAKARLKEGEIPIPEVLHIGEEIAEALTAIARVGVVHRDVKPQNILLCPDGGAKLSDFGIAKQVDGTTYTKTGLGLGTLPYVAPEQIDEGKVVEARTDIYGLGATLYHLIGGNPPFSMKGKAGDLMELITAIIEQSPPPLRALRTDCPEEIEAYLGRMMAKTPEERPDNAADVAVELSRLRQRHYPGYTASGRQKLLEQSGDDL